MNEMEITEEFLALGKRYSQAIKSGEPFAYYAPEMMAFGLDAMLSEHRDIVMPAITEHLRSTGKDVDGLCEVCLVTAYLVGNDQPKVGKQLHDMIEIALK